MASSEEEETRKTNFVIRGIKSYNKYLRRGLNLQINNINEIVSKFIVDYGINNEKIRFIHGSFDDENTKLRPAKYLSEITEETKNFLIEESIGERIKDYAIFFATIIPVVITIFQLLDIIQS